MHINENTWLISYLAEYGIGNLSPLELMSYTDDFDEKIVIYILNRFNFDEDIWEAIKTAYSFCHSDKVLDRIMGRILPPFYHKVEGIIETHGIILGKEEGWYEPEYGSPTKFQAQSYLDNSRSEIQSMFATLQDMVLKHYSDANIINTDAIEDLKRQLEQKMLECKKLSNEIEQLNGCVEFYSDGVALRDHEIEKLGEKISRLEARIKKLKANPGSEEEAKEADLLISLFQERLNQLEEENKDLRLKVAQYEEDKKKSIPKGVAKAVTFNSILNYIESCRDVDEAKTCEYMLLKLMTLGECDKNDFIRLDETMARVNKREARNVNNNFNAPIINTGTLNGDVNNKQDKQDEQ